MLLFVTALKLIAEMALMVLAGQFVLGLLAGAGRDGNVFYRLLQLLSSPFVRATRLITPRQVVDRHVPVAAFCLLVGLWLFATLLKINLCLQIGVAQCQ